MMLCKGRMRTIALLAARAACSAGISVQLYLGPPTRALVTLSFHSCNHPTNTAITTSASFGHSVQYHQATHSGVVKSAVAMHMPVVVLGATGRVGSLVVAQLLERGIEVCVVVRSTAKLASLPQGHGKLRVIQSNLLGLSPEELGHHIADCGAVISCLGHPMTFLGIFGPPRDLVLRAMVLTCGAIELLKPTSPIKLIHLNTIGVDNPDGSDPYRGFADSCLVQMLSAILPSYQDSCRSAQYLHNSIGHNNPHIEWCAVRPDSFRDGAASEYRLHQQLQTRVLAPGKSTMANIARFMCDLALKPDVWDAWKFKMPTILDVPDNQMPSE